MGVVYAAYDPDLDRQVALKLITDRGTGTQSKQRSTARLLREARAMAGLRAPNVITVHDLGEAGGSVFVAMELIRGGTLTEWMGAHDAWAGVVDTFCEAGMGLAAAHDAGMVHRDFKPDNVLIDADGRVVVMDFGLVHRADAGQNDESANDESAGENAPTRPIESGERPLTRTGAIMGTPAYMSPEQFSGLPTDPRSDQFSFCVALWEALHGERPFVGNSFADLALAVHDGALRPVPEDSAVPSELTEIARRGLALDPESRWPSMHALVAALRSVDPDRGRRRLATAIAGLATIGLAVAAGAAARPNAAAASAPCAQAGDAAAEIWSDQRVAGVSAAFADIGSDAAVDAGARATTRLTAFAQAWASARVDACEDTEIRHEQSDTMLDLRMACLDRRLGELTAVADELVNGGPAVLSRSDAVLEVLQPISTCSNRDLLDDELPLPDDPRARAAVAGARDRLAVGLARFRGGRADEATKALVEADEALADTQYVPVHAELALRRGQVALLSGDARASETALRTAVRLGVESGHAPAVAEASYELLMSLGMDDHRHGEAAVWFDLARASVARLGPRRARFEPRVAAAGAYLFQARGDLDRALEQFQRAHRGFSALEGDHRHDLAAIENGIAGVHYDQERFEPALDRFISARDALSDSLGAAHPNVGVAHENVADTQLALGRHEDAASSVERAITVYRAAFETPHPSLADALELRARIELSAGNLAAARASLDETLELRVAIGDQGQLGRSRSVEAEWYLARGETQAALGASRRAVADAEAGQLWSGYRSRVDAAHARIMAAASAG
jgi:tetratricopeptide (TPR) repeat protein